MLNHLDPPKDPNASKCDKIKANVTTGDELMETMFLGIGYPVKATGAGLIIYVIGVFYMFAGIAIVCDEFFVPALDVLTEYSGVSDDVAGATFMAAGGSAPELFTSLIGTFKQSAVGFGTIVGSAVFNVLFVIGMCAIFSKELLVLTWWPLARDSSYYALSLLVLAIFFQDQEIQVWEAAILLCMYGGYVLVMKNNAKLHATIDSWVHNDAKVDPTADGDGKAEKTSRGIGQPNIFLKPGNFRAGVLSHLLQDKAFVDRMSRAVVSRMTGNLKDTFSKIDKDNSGFVDKSELVQLLKELEIPYGEADVKAALQSIDTSNDQRISFEEFSVWYGRAETKINNQIAEAFAEIDTDNNGFIERANLEVLITKLGHDGGGNGGGDEHQFSIDEVWKEACQGGDKDKLNREDFKKWYETSLFYTVHVEEIKKKEDTDGGGGGDDEDSEPLDVSFPEGTWARVNYIVLAPLVLSLHYTVPDVRAEGKRGKFPLAFVGAIVWIGVYSFLMVEWATLIGAAAGIPDTVMGLTFLAAGTSIPDLLTSVIVARQGHGDMAVSSSIGSNIFDVLIGLPFPWFLYACINPHGHGNLVPVQADTLFLSILILFLMLVAVILTIKLNKWRMTKGLGATMFCLYGVFVVQDLLRSGDNPTIPTCFIMDCCEL